MSDTAHFTSDDYLNIYKFKKVLSRQTREFMFYEHLLLCLWPRFQL